jgi:T4-like virus tail tube protein gp19
MSNNFLSPVGYGFKIARTPGVNFSVQKVDLPSITLGTAPVQTPFVKIVNPGNISYGDLVISFRVDEDLSNYLEIYNWIVSLGHPDDLNQYDTSRAARSDGSVMILDSAKNAVMEVQFTDLYPTWLGELQFDSTDTNIQYISVVATFAFNRMYYKPQ